MVKITIDDVECSVESSTAITLSYKSEDLANLESGRTGTTVEVELKLGGENSAIFGIESDTHVKEKFNRDWHEMKIFSDEVELFSGTAYLMEIRWSEGLRTAIIECRGGVSWWATNAASTLLKNIDISYSNSLNESCIKASWLDDSVVKFFPIVRDSYDVEGSSTDVTGVRLLRSIDDYHPFIQVGALLNAIFTSSGYTVQSSTIYDEQFEQLYISGKYSSTESSAAQEAMGFYVKRAEDCTTTTDGLGRISLSPYDIYSTVGNIVDIETVDSDYECYNHGNVMQIDGEALIFRPLTEVCVGFEYFLHYTCLCTIESRTTLKGVNKLNTISDGYVEWEITNRYEDHRDSYSTKVLYNVIIFDFEEGDQYQLVGITQEGERNVLGTFYQRLNSMVFTDEYPTLTLEKHNGIGYMTYADDWALYYGYIDLTSSTEVKITLRSSPHYYSPTSPMQFELQMLEGGDPGVDFTLHKDCTVRPYFSSYPGYNSTVTFEDIAQHSVSALDFLGAMQHLYNLRFATNEEAKTVRIESFDEFYNLGEWDWSDKVVAGETISLTDLAHLKHRTNTLGYQQTDGVVNRMGESDNAYFGEWSYEVDSYAASSSSSSNLNPIFSASTNDEDGVMVVGDRDDIELVDSLNFSPRIARYFDMREVASENYSLPYVAFHSPDEGFSLCFEDRDSVAGLNRHYTTEVALHNRSQLISLRVKLSALDYSALFSMEESSPSIRSTFLFTLHGESFRTILYSVESYNLESGIAQCLFLTID